MTAVRTSIRTFVALLAVAALMLLALLISGAAPFGSDQASTTWHKSPQASTTWHVKGGTLLASTTWHMVGPTTTSTTWH